MLLPARLFIPPFDGAVNALASLLLNMYLVPPTFLGALSEIRSAMKLDVVQLTQELVAYPSESQTSNVEVTQHVARVLDQLGFQIEEVPYTDEAGVDKLSIVGKLGTGEGGLALMSHDDVVPANPADGWLRDPYESYEANGKLYGRGSCDMKGPLAASICAAARFKAADLKAPLYIVVTADEEVLCVGAQKVTAHSKFFAEASTGCGIICEPTSLRVVPRPQRLSRHASHGQRTPRTY